MIKAYLNDVDVNTFGFILEDYAVGSPTMQTSKVTILGRNGELDYSSALTGLPSYSNRIITLKLGLFVEGAKREIYYTNFVNRFVGKRVKVRFSNLEGYFEGVVQVPTRTTELLHTIVTLTIDCYPFRIKSKEKKNVTLSNTKQRITLDVEQATNITITTTGNAIIEYEDMKFSYGAGTRKMNYLISNENNILEVSGNDLLTIEYNIEVI